MSTKQESTLVLLLLAVALGVVAMRLEVTTDISELLPVGSDRVRGQLFQSFARGEATRTMVLTIEAESPEQALAISRGYQEEVLRDAELLDALAAFEAGPPAGIEEGLWVLYHPRRLSFAAVDEAAARALVSDEGLAAVATSLRRQLETPLSTLISRIAPEDPFLATAGLFDRLQQGSGGAIRTIDGRFVVEDGRAFFAVFIIATHASAFDASAQRSVANGLEAAHARLSERMQVRPFEVSGLARHTMRAEQTIEADIRRTTSLSVGGLFVLCLVVFRSFRLVLLTLVPIGCAMLAATAACLLVFGRVHAITFAFGASLIGVCVDYAVHLYVHHRVHPDPSGPPGTLRRIWPGLWVGALTTTSAFAVIAASSLPGLRQVGVFSAVGIAAALVSTRALLPRLLSGRPARVGAAEQLTTKLAGIFEWWRNQRGLGWALVVVTLGFTAWGIRGATWEDDLGAMTRLDAEILAEDERVRERVGHLDQGRFIVALGATEERALQVNDSITDELERARTAEEVGAWHGVSRLVPSAARQKEIASILHAAPALRPRLERALSAAGFDEKQFGPFFEHLENPPAPPLTFAQIHDSPARTLVEGLRVEFDGQVGFVTLLRDVRAFDAICSRIEPIEGAYCVDQQATMRGAMRTYRSRSFWLLGAGLLAMMSVLGARYRSFRVVLATVAPALLAAGTTMAVLAIMGRALDLVALTALVMVLGIGVDYAVFLMESRRVSGRALPATLAALVVCWLTTVLGFGVLGLSRHPMMSTIGIVAAVGVSTSLLLAPTAIALLRR